MSMTIAATRNLPDRFGGFLNSCMQEIAPGIYVAPRMKKAVRERVWQVMMDWAELVPDDGGIILFWKSQKAPSGLGVRFLGFPKKQLVEHEGVWLTLRDLTTAHHIDELQEVARTAEPPFADKDTIISLL